MTNMSAQKYIILLLVFLLSYALAAEYPAPTNIMMGSNMAPRDIGVPVPLITII